MAAKRKREVVSTAFALGGFGGSNLHGLGFLHAAVTKAIVPDMISCTSGQIHAVWKYLQAKDGRLSADGSDARNLEDVARAYTGEAEIKPKLPYPEIVSDVPDLVSASLKHLSNVESFKDNPFGYFMNVTMNNLPARLLAPKIEDHALERMSRDFNEEAKIGIVFNSHNPREGREYVYLNPRAAHLLNRSPHSESSFRKTAHHSTEYRPITPENILDALWIYEYGFEGRQCVDGAYFRQVMLSELSRAKIIFVARPIQWKWADPMPVTFGETQDLKTEVFFNAAYYGERFRIELINRLLREHALDKEFVEREGYHKVAFYETEPRTPKPFIGYFSESMKMFCEAREDADKAFAEAQAASGHG
jgi:hypothetical protein